MMEDDRVAVPSDRELVEALRRGDEAAFATLVEELQPILRRAVRQFVKNAGVVDDILQETWLGVIRGIFAFECRSSLKSWIFRIMMNRARSHVAREKRTIPFVDIETRTWPLAAESAAGSPGPRTASTDPRPLTLRDGGPDPGQALLGKEARERLTAAIEALPPNLRMVLSLRDVEGWSSEDVCNALGIRETNQRVLLHRARTRLRGTLEPYLQGDPEARHPAARRRRRARHLAGERGTR
jgi:RNA polymerase sigma-70 factor (ECF subfamily)